MSTVWKKIPTPSLVEQHQRKVLQGVTEINTKMHKLPLDDRMAYLLHAESSLSFRIGEVRHYIKQLNVPEKAEDLAAIQIMEQDLMRIISMVLDLQERHRLGSATDSSRASTPTRGGDSGRRASLAPTTTEVEPPHIALPFRTKPEGNSEKPAIRGILRPPLEEFSEDLLKETGKVESAK
ncbi:hypothetical protein DSL72_006263 [Monilinia vaccinii-corymbosi]|uniref:Uncharacterized protein n=1 Tax=Monilinia vaccinii-corymbosi TaxID=61207 RepID=A0A8A3PLS8_9HELO|nr:hypothetical protein DSL72_006263 [Monilinia vaccinii-corymbosi]